MAVNHYIIKNNTISGKTEVKYIEYTDVAMAISGGTFTGQISATTVSGYGSGLTNIPGSLDTYLTGTTFSGNTLIGEMSDGSTLNATITELSGVTFGGFEAGDSRLKHWVEIYENGNSLTTTISTTATPVKVNTTSNLGGARGFTMPVQNRITYTAITSGQTFAIVGSISAEAASGSQVFQFSIYKNGVTELVSTIIENEFTSSRRSVSFSGVVELAENDYLEIWTQNNTSNKNLEVYNFNLSLTQV